MAPGPKRSGESLRNNPSWRANTSYYRLSNLDRVQRFLALQKLNGGDGPSNFSEVADAALTAWLNQHLPPSEQAGVRNLLG